MKTFLMGLYFGDGPSAKACEFVLFEWTAEYVFVLASVSYETIIIT